MKATKRIKQKGIKVRAIIFGLMFSLLFIAIGAESVYLQVFCGPSLSEKAADQYERCVKSSPKRGTVYDRNLREMAISLEVTSIGAHPGAIKDPKSSAKSLSKALGMDFKPLYRLLSSDKPFVWIKRQVNPRDEKKARDLNIEGIIFNSEYSRFYPNKTLAGQVLGFTGIDGQGLEGIEFSFNSYLKGEEVNLTVLKDALGRSFDSKQELNPDIIGKNIVLTIDNTIQYIAEKALEEAVCEFLGKSGMAIVMNPKTGELLAIAHYPYFNPNSYNKYERSLWRNRSITDSYEPGSTMKIFAASTAIEAGLCSPDSIFFCENGHYKIGKNTVKEASNHSYGWLSLQQIIQYSSNIGAIKIEELIGPEILYYGLRNFGFGQKTEIDCLGETSGNLSFYKDWARIDGATIAFGQGVSVSAMQLICAVSAIANNGVLMKPYLVQAITDINGKVIKNTTPQPLRRVVSVNTAMAVKRIMKSVIEEEGTGTNAALEGYQVCGKTGTAQKLGPSGTYEKGKYISSFIGFVPADDPALAIYVVVDEPQKRHYGGTIAAPAFKNIAHEVLDYLNISPTQDPDIFTVSWDSEARG